MLTPKSRDVLKLEFCMSVQFCERVSSQLDASILSDSKFNQFRLQLEVLLIAVQSLKADVHLAYQSESYHAL